MIGVKLTVQIKLLPTPEQANSLRTTLETANKAANRLSQLAWNVQEFRRFPIHKAFYRQIRDEFPLSSQIVCLLTAKVADAYKLDKKIQRVFRKHGSISYDSRLLAINLPKSLVSIWVIDGRAKITFTCSDKQRELLQYPRGEADLIFRNKKWFLNITIEIPEEKEAQAIDCLGVDMGIVEIAYDSDGNHYSGKHLNMVRCRNQALRKKLQKVGTKSAKRLLKARSKKEANFARITNHTISKQIVQNAKRTNRAIAVEDLTGIRTRVRARKQTRTKLHNWGFAQLGGFIKYKAALNGVPLLVVDPRNSSRRCSLCGHTENADKNSAKNLRLRGLEILGTGALEPPKRDGHYLWQNP